MYGDHDVDGGDADDSGDAAAIMAMMTTVAMMMTIMAMMMAVAMTMMTMAMMMTIMAMVMTVAMTMTMAMTWALLMIAGTDVLPERAAQQRLLPPHVHLQHHQRDRRPHLLLHGRQRHLQRPRLRQRTVQM